ncbi:MAG TPA: cytochrome P450 [Allosphingosinicella sp.]|jgi:hypothetical protein
MPPQEFLGNVILLIVGGSDTSRSTMSALPAANHLWPEEWNKLRADPALIPSAAQELIRWQTPLAHMRRTATADCVLAGRRIAEGDKLALWYASANRDETVFEAPEVFLADRPGVRRHLAFGSGAHRCVGARLAELQIADRRWRRPGVADDMFLQMLREARNVPEGDRPAALVGIAVGPAAKRFFRRIGIRPLGDAIHVRGVIVPGATSRRPPLSRCRAVVPNKRPNGELRELGARLRCRGASRMKGR